MAGNCHDSFGALLPRITWQRQARLREVSGAEIPTSRQHRWCAPSAPCRDARAMCSHGSIL